MSDPQFFLNHFMRAEQIFNHNFKEECLKNRNLFVLASTFGPLQVSIPQRTEKLF